ncbi:cytochrome c biogenesis protein ResB [Alkalicoccobacillus murimartini]|uniref:Cytochrome c biogenesis protein n=1 Tax=Alkalicoccobacillus murimartini TaxID=171685 RepID=A0ABT9YDF8_9BACI|nr:cytochrome c biogenesis protein ResB [Alkalicoccobacillus murimartini]MDQ0205862.1 cytochrome c biogenesis protein [Alkalicoccobacillus murimartini]
MGKVHCECGQPNSEGTLICQRCGKPLEKQEAESTLLNMRYEGAARRSKTYTSTIVDKVWVFFSSVKVGIWILVILLFASALGSVFPQEVFIPGDQNASFFYREEYGFLGQLYYDLGFHNLYSSWWYMLLLASLGISLIIASLDRVVPLYKSLSKQRVTRHKIFLSKQRLFSKTQTQSSENEQLVHLFKENLRKKRYKVREDQGNILAEKNRFARWGPYVNHIGIIIFLIGCMLRYFPGMYVDETMWVREGEQATVPSTDSTLYVENERFFVEYYDESDETFQDALDRNVDPVVKTFQTDVILFEEDADVIGVQGEKNEVARQEIRVNEPLRYEGISLYQTQYKLNELNQLSFTLENKETGESYGRMDVDLFDPQTEYELEDGYKVEVMGYFPDYYMNDQNQPSTRSRIPDNPYFFFKMFTPETPEGEVSFVGIQDNREPLGENEYKMTFVDVVMKNVSILTVRKDYTIPFLIVGATIFMIGLVQGAYWMHRRIWLQKVDGEWWLAGHTNKSWVALQRDMNGVIEGTTITKPIDQSEKKTTSKKNESGEG